MWLVYAYYFASSKISGDPAAWGQLGDFIGGVTHPFLSFLTLIILSLTLILQSRQLSISATELELSRKELELTRGELRRSVRAQEQSQEALRVQAGIASRSARLSTANFLLGYSESEIESLSDYRPRTAMEDKARKTEIERRNLVLSRILDGFYKGISGEGPAPEF